MVLLGMNCFRSRGGRGCGIAWGELFQFPGVGEAVVLLGMNCFNSRGGRGCGIAWDELFQFPGWARLWRCLG